MLRINSNKRYIFLFAFTFLTKIILMSQGDLLFMLQNNHQSSQLNPAMVSTDKFNLSLPTFHFMYANQGFSLADLITDEIEGKRFFSFDKAYEEAKDINQSSAMVKLDYGSLYFKLKGLGISIGGSFNVVGQVGLTKDLMGLLAFGNATYIGQTLEIGPELFLQSYHELYLGTHFSVGNIDFGVRGKIINGVEDISTDENSIEFTTDDEIYAINLQNNYIINTSALFDYQGLDDLSFDYNGYTLNNLLKYNFGFGLDIGARVHLNETSHIGIAINNIGSITWDRRVKNFSSIGQEGFAGLDISDYIGDPDDIIIEDSLYDILNFQETRQTYNTSLPFDATFNYFWQYSDRTSFGMVARYRSVHNNNWTTFSLQFGRKIFNWWTVGSSLGYRSKSLYLDLLSELKLGAFRGFINFENVFGIFKPAESKYTGLTLGAYVTFISQKKIYKKIDPLIELEN